MPLLIVRTAKLRLMANVRTAAFVCSLVVVAAAATKVFEEADEAVVIVKGERSSESERDVWRK